jgi:NADH-quinone oxidoreductase subunit G
LSARLSNEVDVALKASPASQGLQRVAEVPIYASDALVRRAASLQLTADAREARAGLAPGLWASLELKNGDRVRITQAGGQAVLVASLEPTLAEGCVRVPAGVAETARLGAITAGLTLERLAPSAQAHQAQESGVAA